MRPAWLLSLGVLAAVACTRVPAGQTPAARGASAELRDAQGQLAGSAELAARGADSTMVTIRVNAASGARGVHLHAVGRCEAPTFASADGHLNPFAHQHGRRNPRGAHAGDLPNLPPGGTLTFTMAVPFDSIIDADGSAIVVHANADDEMTDPSGNSGPRLLCGAVAPASGRRTAP
jgi:Cu-Zn family superoxide dismutase